MNSFRVGKNIFCPLRLWHFFLSRHQRRVCGHPTQKPIHFHRYSVLAVLAHGWKHGICFLQLSSIRPPVTGKTYPMAISVFRRTGRTFRSPCRCALGTFWWGTMAKFYGHRRSRTVSPPAHTHTHTHLNPLINSGLDISCVFLMFNFSFRRSKDPSIQPCRERCWADGKSRWGLLPATTWAFAYTLVSHLLPPSTACQTAHGWPHVMLAGWTRAPLLTL